MYNSLRDLFKEEIDEEMRRAREEGLQAGRVEGRQEGREQGRQEGREQGRELRMNLLNFNKKLSGKL